MNEAKSKAAWSGQNNNITIPIWFIISDDDYFYIAVLIFHWKTIKIMTIRDICSICTKQTFEENNLCISAALQYFIIKVFCLMFTFIKKNAASAI